MEQINLFILTEEWQDVNNRLLLKYVCLSEEGPVEILINNSYPVFFVERSADLSQLQIQYKKKEVDFYTYNKTPVDALYFRTQGDLKRADEFLISQNISTYEADIDPARRYLMEKNIYAQVNVEGEPVKTGNIKRFINPKITPGEYTPTLTIVSLDIETGVNNKVYSIAVHLTTNSKDNKKDIRSVFTLNENVQRSTAEKHEKFSFQYFPDESSLINEFTGWIKKNDPDIIIGWHVIGFDLTFLFNRSKELGVPFNISRNGKFSLYSRKGGRNFADITGRVVVDGPVGLRSAFYTFEDYRLDTVAEELLGYGKTIKSTSAEKVEEIEKLFREDKVTLAEYNMNDAVLVTEIFKKTELLNQYIKRSQLSGLPFDKLLMMTAAFDHFYLPKLHKEGYVACNVRDIVPNEPAQGGYVLDPIPGIYDNVIVLDFKSLYPTIIQTFKIDPISLLNNDVDTITTPAGFKFSRTKNYLPEFIKNLLYQRSEAKKNGDVHLSQAIKILMNSFYGVMGSTGCRFYHQDLPSGITSTGQFLLLNSKTFLENNGYKVLYGDTDSLFVKMKANESGDLFIHGKRIAQELNLYWKERLLNEYKVESYIEIEFEKVYRKFVLTPARGSESGAKKRYAGLLLKGDKESIEFTGLENVRSDWTPLAKEFQSELYRRIFYGEEYHVWMNELVKDLKQGLLDSKLVYTKRLRKENEEYIKNIPPQVKAARMLSVQSSRISYVITKKGPIPIELNPIHIDYEHYIEKQLQPIADSVLVLLGESFGDIISNDQLSFFS